MADFQKRLEDLESGREEQKKEIEEMKASQESKMNAVTSLVSKDLTEEYPFVVLKLNVYRVAMPGNP